MRIVQASTSERSCLLVGYLTPPVRAPGQPSLDEQLRAALPDATIILYEKADGEPLEQTIAYARKAGWRGERLALCGYSAGCLRGVRQRLRDGAEPDAILAIDGTHTSLPPAPWQLDVWRPFIAAARRGEKLVVITCSQQTYTEKLPANERFQSTLNVARTLTGLALVQPGPLPLGEEHVAGGLRVHNYASKTIDATAHSQQLTHVLPEMVRRHLAPWLAGHAAAAPTATVAPAAPATLARGMHGAEVSAWQARLNDLGFDCGNADGDFGPVTERATRALQTRAGLPATGIVDERTRDAAREALPPTEPRVATGTRLGDALLAQARADLGVREERTNDGARIREYFAGTGVAPPAHWCAAALRFWLRAAARAAGVTAPIAGSVGAKATMVQLQAAHRWISADDLRRDPTRLRPGMIVVWHRGAPGAYTGHIGVVATVNGHSFTTVEGNSGAASNAVATMARSLADVNLLGSGWID